MDCECSGQYRPTQATDEDGGDDVCPIRGTKKTGCLFQIKLKRMQDDEWSVRTDKKRGKHNHELGESVNWHTSRAKLNEKEFETVAKLKRSNMRPKGILSHLKSEGNEGSNLKHIYNASHKISKMEMGNLEPMPYFFKLLNEYGYFRMYNKEKGSNKLANIFFCHPKTKELIRLFPQVLIMDVTYKTNRFNCPLLEVISILPTGQNYHVGFAYMKDETANTFMWVLDKVKMLFDGIDGPKVIVTDRELAAMKAIEIIFQDTAHFLCRRHISMDIQNYLMKLTGSDKYMSPWRRRWSDIINARTVHEYEERVQLMDAKWSKIAAFTSYVHKTWLDPYRQ